MLSVEFKKTYNSLLQREEKGRMLIDNPKTSEKKREHYLFGVNGYMDICKKLSAMMNEYKQITGQEMDTETALGGFKEV